jgi:myo-inositol-1(or 4)-monophosphatase
MENIRDIILGRLEAFVSVAHGIRTMGSAALTLCHVAMGAVEGYHSDNLMPWDVAAGVLIIREAGGVVIDTNGIICLRSIAKTKLTYKLLTSFFVSIRWRIQRYVTEIASCW